MARASQYQTPPELAIELGVKPEKIRNWIESGQLTAVNLGDATRPRWRISAEAKQLFLEQRSSQKPTAITSKPRRGRAKQDSVIEFFK